MSEESNNNSDDNNINKIIEYRTYNADTDQNSLLELIQYLQDYECQLYDRMKPSKDYITTKYIQDLLDTCEESYGEILVAVVVIKKKKNEDEKDSKEDDADVITVVVVVGYAVVLTKVQSREEHEIDYIYGEITDLAVHPNYQRRGIAKTLLDQCENKVREAGTQYLRTEVLSKNTTAVSTYQKYGFKSHLITMEKKLSS